MKKSTIILWTVIILGFIICLMSCKSVISHKEHIFNGEISVVTYTNTDTLCVNRPIRLKYTYNKFGAKIPFYYASQDDTINTVLIKGETTYTGMYYCEELGHMETFDVIFASPLQEEWDIILAMYFDDRTIIIGEECPK